MAGQLQTQTLHFYQQLQPAWKLAPLILGITYGIIEYFYISPSPLAPIYINPPTAYYYRTAYITTLLLPFTSRNYWRWFSNGTLTMTIEDASYWIFNYWKTGALPVQWAWYYPVWNNIPLLYLCLPLVFLTYMKGRDSGKIHSSTLSQLNLKSSE